MEMTQDNLCVVVGIHTVIADFKEVTRSTTAVLYYDTTFSMGDFYVSALLYRNIVFRGCPVIPLLLLVHERRTTDSHALLFKWFKKLTSSSAPVLVVDREQSISTAAKSVMPDCQLVYCWNHIMGDVRVSCTLNVPCVVWSGACNRHSLY